MRGDGIALDLVGRASEVVVPLGQSVELAAHLPYELAVVYALDDGYVVCILRDKISQTTHEMRPLGAGHLSPRSFIESLAGRALTARSTSSSSASGARAQTLPV